MREVSPYEARTALETINTGRLRIVDQIAVPTWYWCTVAAGWVTLGVVSDLGHWWATTAATLAFGTLHAAIAPRAISGRHGSNQLSVRADIVGHRVSALVIGGLILLTAVTVAAALALNADGTRHPATAASTFVATTILLGGPMLLARVRHTARIAVTR